MSAVGGVPAPFSLTVRNWSFAYQRIGALVYGHVGGRQVGGDVHLVLGHFKAGEVGVK